jgi:hypothetical protein
MAVSGLFHHFNGEMKLAYSLENVKAVAKSKNSFDQLMEAL